VPDRPAGMHPCIDTPWARLKEKRPHFLPGIALVIEEEKEERICHGSETGFASTTIASLARFLADMVVIPIGHDTPEQTAQVTFHTLPDPSLSRHGVHEDDVGVADMRAWQMSPVRNA